MKVLWNVKYAEKYLKDDDYYAGNEITVLAGEDGAVAVEKVRKELIGSKLDIEDEKDPIVIEDIRIYGLDQIATVDLEV